MADRRGRGYWGLVFKKAWESSSEHFAWKYPVLGAVVAFGIRAVFQGWKQAVSDIETGLWAAATGVVVAVIVYCVNLVRAGSEIFAEQLRNVERIEADRDAALRRVSDLARSHKTELARIEAERAQEKAPSIEFLVDFDHNGYYVYQDSDEQNLWVFVAGVLITNQTEKKLPLELSIEIGSTNEFHSLSEHCITTAPGESLRSDLKEETLLGRVLNLPPLESRDGYLATRFNASELFAFAQVKDTKELAHKRAVWVVLIDKSRHLTMRFPLNYIARSHDHKRSRAEKSSPGNVS